MENKLSIIIPVFNEKKLLLKFFTDLFSAYSNHYVNYVIINDGSYDGSELWLKKNIEPLANKKIKKIYLTKDNKFKIKHSNSKLLSKFNEIQLINHNKNIGKGAAVINGLKKAKGNFLMILDSDMEYDTEDSLYMYETIQNGKMGDVIFGSRYTRDLPHRHRYYLHTLANKLNTYLFNIFFSSHISDIHCGLKIFSRDVYKKIRLSSYDFSIDLDLGTQIAKSGFLISEVGVSYYSRSYYEGKKITWLDGLLSYYYIFKFRFIKNNIKNNLLIYLSMTTGLITGLHFGQGIGKILATIFCVFLGSIYGIRGSFLGLLLLIVFMLVGSQFGNGLVQIFATAIFAFTAIFLSNKLDKRNK